MFGEFTSQAGRLISNNATTILTAAGVIGSVGTAVLSFRAGLEARERLSELDFEIVKSDGTTPDDISEAGPTFLEKAKVVAPTLVVPSITGLGTVAAIIFAHRISAGKAAALAAAYGASAKQRDEYKAKLEEKLGLKKAETARAELQGDRQAASNARTEMVIVSGGSVLCYDSFSDRYIRTTAEAIRQAEKKCKEIVELTGECDVRTFYKDLGFDSVQWDDMLGWNTGNPPSITIDTTMVNDEPCLSIELNHLPMPDFQDRDSNKYT